MAFRPSERSGSEKRPPPSFHRLKKEPEEEEEEHGPRGGGMSLRRPGPLMPWRGGGEERSSAIPERSYEEPEMWDELADFMVPEGVERKPGGLFPLWEMELPEIPAGRGYREDEPRETYREPSRGGGGAGPRPGGPPPAAGPRPSRSRAAGPPVVDPQNCFKLETLWNKVRQRRADSKFRPGSAVGIEQVAQASPDEMSRAMELVRFFHIPKQKADQYPGRAIWDNLLHPFMDELSYALNQMKPNDIPGEFGFQAGRDGSFWLGYME